MRVIKFRYVYKKLGMNPLFQLLLLEEIEAGKVEVIPGWAIIAKNQFTGLLDKNGVEIYESDIVLSHYKSGMYKKVTVEFKSNEAAQGFSIRKSANYEVVGNIYEQTR